MKPPLLIKGMHGLGDNLHQRAIVRHYMTQHDVWLESSWVAPYHDLVDAGLMVIHKRTSLRTQTKNANREATRFSHMRPRHDARVVNVVYRPAEVIARGSVLAAMAFAAGCPAASDFRLPVPADWTARAAPIVERAHGKPIMVYRPLVLRTEWGGCGNRNPDHDAYAALLASIRDRFFVISIADLVPRVEWIAGRPVAADLEYHGGELDFETIAALISRAALVFTAPGFAVVLAQAVGTPVVCVFGGYENSSSFSAGARFTPYLGIDPIRPCHCWSHTHACDKRIDMPRALAALRAFVDRSTAHETDTHHLADVCG